MELKLIFLTLLGLISVGTAAPGGRNCTILPPGQIEMLGCCNFPEMGVDEHVPKCIADTPFDPTEPLLSLCQIQKCHFERANVLVGDNVDKTKLLGFIQNSLPPEHPWLNSVVSQFKECIDLMNEKQDSVVKMFKAWNFDVNKCNPVHLTLESCVFMQLFRKCPANDWKDEQVCADWKDYFDDCYQEEDILLKLNNVKPDDLIPELSMDL